MAQENVITDKREEKERRKELRRKIKQDKAEAKKIKRASRRIAVKESIGGVDLVVLVTVVLFSLFGTAMVFSAGYYQTINTSHPNPFYYLIRQGGFVVTGWILMYLSNKA